MTREIKFRAWDPSRQKMLTSPKWVEFRVDKDGVLTARNYARGGNLQTLDVMQYTGLRDRNGVEIYEGDILHCGDPEEMPLTVIWSDRWYGWGLSNGEHFSDFHMEGLEVIGNIHETPDLLA